MAKPAGPRCNLACQYCYYLEKENLYGERHRFRMPDEVLERFVPQYIAASPGPEISFAWQGGEPTLMGLEFFQRVVELQEKHRPDGSRITNAFQTNGMLLDDEWCDFLKRQRFLVGLSIDGPRDFHDRHRVDRSGKPTFDRVVTALERLRRHGVEFNTLTVVHRENSQAPLEVYRFLREQGSRFLQFIPLVERVRPDGSLAEPPHPSARTDGSRVSDWSVRPEDYGRFLCEIFDEWVSHDVGLVHVQLFEVQLAIRMGLPSPLCLFAPTCGRGLILEHNGDVYACDHYVYPEYGRGNLLTESLSECVASPEQKDFGRLKRDALPEACRECAVRVACHGECPKHRFVTTTDGQPGLNYLCPAYTRFFRHIDSKMRAMADLLERGLPAALIMDPHRGRRDVATGRVGRNDPCPCGSGRKYKKCCGGSRR
jgi:uncharacterized protein